MAPAVVLGGWGCQSWGARGGVQRHNPLRGCICTAPLAAKLLSGVRGDLHVHGCISEQAAAQAWCCSCSQGTALCTVPSACAWSPSLIRDTVCTCRAEFACTRLHLHIQGSICTRRVAFARARLHLHMQGLICMCTAPFAHPGQQLHRSDVHTQSTPCTLRTAFAHPGHNLHTRGTICTPRAALWGLPLLLNPPTPQQPPPKVHPEPIPPPALSPRGPLPNYQRLTRDEQHRVLPPKSIWAPLSVQC